MILSLTLSFHSANNLILCKFVHNSLYMYKYMVMITSNNTNCTNSHTNYIVIQMSSVYHSHAL